MSKAALIIEMPECCADCDLTCDDCAGLFCIPADRYYDGEDSMEDKPIWCPLREVVDK